jgi:hypothetical protein
MAISPLLKKRSLRRPPCETRSVPSKWDWWSRAIRRGQEISEKVPEFFSGSIDRRSFGWSRGRRGGNAENPYKTGEV